MKVKETDSNIPIFPLKTGDKVDKAGKKGEVIQVSPENDILVMWPDAKMTSEKPDNLVKLNESVFSQYLKQVKRI